MDFSANQFFKTSIFTLYTGHAIASLFRRQGVDSTVAAGFTALGDGHSSSPAEPRVIQAAESGEVAGDASIRRSITRPLVEATSSDLSPGFHYYRSGGSQLLRAQVDLELPMSRFLLADVPDQPMIGLIFELMARGQPVDPDL